MIFLTSVSAHDNNLHKSKDRNGRLKDNQALTDLQTSLLTKNTTTKTSKTYQDERQADSWKLDFKRNLLNTKCNNIGLKNAQKGIQNNSQKDRNMTKSARCWHAQVFTKSRATLFTKGGRHFSLSSCDTLSVSCDTSQEGVRYWKSIARHFP